MKIKTGFLLLVIFAATTVAAQLNTDKQLAYCTAQASRTLITLHDFEHIPRSIASGKTNWSLISYKDWCSGFWPGILWYVYEYTNDEKIKKQAGLFSGTLFPIALITPIPVTKTLLN